MLTSQLMAGFSWILSLICLAAAHPSSASPVLGSALVVPAGRNASLSCNLTSSGDITWYLLRQDELLPLLTVAPTKLKKKNGNHGDGTTGREDVTVTVHAEDPRLSSHGEPEDGPVRLHIQQVEQQDAGLYFCTGRCAGSACASRGRRLLVDGVDVDSSRLPCLSLGVCLLPPLLLLLLLLVFIVGLCLCSGKPAVCCCDRSRNQPVTEVSLHYSSLRHHKPRPPGRAATGLVEKDVTYSALMSRKPAVCCCDRSRNQPVTEVSLHYSSLRHHKPRPPGRAATGLVEKDVTYSALMSRKNPNGSRDQK